MLNRYLTNKKSALGGFFVEFFIGKCRVMKDLHSNWRVHMSEYSEEIRANAFLDVLFATVLSHNPMKQEKLYELSMHFMDHLEKKGIHIFGFAPEQSELRVQAYRVALESARDYDLLWLKKSGFTSKMTPRAVHLICTRPGVLTEEELSIAREAVETAQLKRSLEVVQIINPRS